MNKPTFLKFIGYSGVPIVVQINKVKSFYPHETSEYTYTVFEFEEGGQELYVRCAFDDVCKAVSNWCVVDGTYCK